jgi:hypothetical protein
LKIRTLTFVSGLLAVVLAFGGFGSLAMAETEISSPGSGANQTKDPRGIAIDEKDKLLYVADRGNNRIAVFDASTGDFVRAFGWGVATGANELQVCTATCQAGIGGSGSGQLKDIDGIAVDNAEDTGSVYVFDVGNRRVQKFTSVGEFVWLAGDGVNVTTGGDLCTAASGNTCGPGTGGDAAGQLNVSDGDTIDVGPGGTVYVGDRVSEGATGKTRVQLYSPAGAYLGLLGGKLLEVTGGAGAARALAVDLEGDVYVGTAGERGAVRKYDASGNELLSFNNPSFNIETIAIDSKGHVFIGDTSEASTIYEYLPDGTLLKAIYGPLKSETFGLAVSPPSPDGDIFVVEAAGLEKRILKFGFPPPGPVVHPVPSSTFAAPIGNTKATLNSKINPEGEATTYYFEYITDADYDAAGGTFGAGTIKTAELGPLSADFKLHPVQMEVTGLIAETEYHFRALAENTSGNNEGPRAAFTTKPPLEFGDIWSSKVGTTTATLNAEVNPLGIPATARFEYLELSEWEATGWAGAKVAPAGEEIDLGEGEEAMRASAQVEGLAPGTPYRFRVVATDRCKPEPAPLCEFAEPEATFITFQVLTPRIGCPNDDLRAAGSGTFLPDCRGYEMVSPVDKNNAFIEPVFNANGFPAGLDQAGVSGDSVTYSAYKAFGKVQSAPYTNQYLSRRTAGGWQTEGISPKREGPSLMTYLSSQLDRQYKAFTEDLCSGWVVQDANPILAEGAPLGFPGLYRRDNCEPGTGSYEPLITVEPPSLPPSKVIPELQGFSTDGSVSIYAVDDNLTSGLPNQPLSCRNEAEGCLSHLYEARAGTLSYVCVLPNGTPYKDACGAGTPSGTTIGRTASVNNAVSEDGSRIFWSGSKGGPGPLYIRIDNSEPSAKTVLVSEDDAQFWTAAADGSKAIYSVEDELFEYDVDSETATPIAEDLIGLAGASEDASRIYFASTKVLTGEEENSAGDKAVAGKPNLYLYEAGSGFEFVGTLADSDLTSASQPSSPIADNPVSHLSRVNADGGSLAFMSSAQLTGYNNKDAETPGKVAMEVFLYDADANAGEGAILCPSCNPTGARPEGRQLTQKLLESRWAASRIPVFESQLYGSRVLSEDGNRLYFNSFDKLSPLDDNEQEDVYQWEAVGTGDCDESKPTYHEVSGGCIDLISSGQSTEGSELVDISSDGADVFFKTNESLVTQDPALRDIYDARVEGGFPPLPIPPVICQEEDECLEEPKPAPAAPAPSSQIPGPGNPAWPKPKCPKGKHKAKVKGKVRCVKNKKKKNKAGKRAANKNRRAAR